MWFVVTGLSKASSIKIMVRPRILCLSLCLHLGHGCLISNTCNAAVTKILSLLLCWSCLLVDYFIIS